MGSHLPPGYIRHYTLRGLSGCHRKTPKGTKTWAHRTVHRPPPQGVEPWAQLKPLSGFTTEPPAGVTYANIVVKKVNHLLCPSKSRFYLTLGDSESRENQYLLYHRKTSSWSTISTELLWPLEWSARLWGVILVELIHVNHINISSF